MLEKGHIGLIYCRKNITEATANIMIEKYAIIQKNLNSEDKQSEMYMLYKEYLIEMDMISLFSIKQILNTNIEQFVSNLKDSEINIYVVSGDSHLRTLGACY